MIWLCFLPLRYHSHAMLHHTATHCNTLQHTATHLDDAFWSQYSCWQTPFLLYDTPKYKQMGRAPSTCLRVKIIKKSARYTIINRKMTIKLTLGVEGRLSLSPPQDNYRKTNPNTFPVIPCILRFLLEIVFFAWLCLQIWSAYM